MTNNEKYKDPNERANKFVDYCNTHKNCEGCPLDTGESPLVRCAEAVVRCVAVWGELDASEEEELLPCPFCGGTPTVNSTIASTDGWESRDIVMCNTCGIQFHGQNAIEKWNRRY